MSSNGTARHAAAAVYGESVAAGVPLTGTQLAERFDRSPRWGRSVIAECRSTQIGQLHEMGTAAGNDQASGDVSNLESEVADIPRPEPMPAASAAPQRVTTAAVLAVAAVAAVASYDHQRVLAEMAGEGWRSWLLPLSVDGLMVVASMTAITRRRAGLPAGGLAWVAMLLGIVASITANIAAAEPTTVGRLVAAWPPLALLLAFELALQQRQR